MSMASQNGRPRMISGALETKRTHSAVRNQAFLNFFFFFWSCRARALKGNIEIMIVT